MNLTRLTGGPHYLRTFYLQIRSFTFAKLVKNAYFLVKNGLFICEFSIRGPKWRDASTANNEGNLYCLTKRKSSKIFIQFSIRIVQLIAADRFYYNDPIRLWDLVRWDNRHGGDVRQDVGQLALLQHDSWHGRILAGGGCETPNRRKSYYNGSRLGFMIDNIH